MIYNVYVNRVIDLVPGGDYERMVEILTGRSGLPFFNFKELSLFSNAPDSFMCHRLIYAYKTVYGSRYCRDFFTTIDIMKGCAISPRVYYCAFLKDNPDIAEMEEKENGRFDSEKSRFIFGKYDEWAKKYRICYKYSDEFVSYIYIRDIQTKLLKLPENHVNTNSFFNYIHKNYFTDKKWNFVSASVCEKIIEDYNEAPNTFVSRVKRESVKNILQDSFSVANLSSAQEIIKDYYTNKHENDVGIELEYESADGVLPIPPKSTIKPLYRQKNIEEREVPGFLDEIIHKPLSEPKINEKDNDKKNISVTVPTPEYVFPSKRRISPIDGQRNLHSVADDVDVVPVVAENELCPSTGNDNQAVELKSVDKSSSKQNSSPISIPPMPPKPRIAPIDKQSRWRPISDDADIFPIVDTNNFGRHSVDDSQPAKVKNATKSLSAQRNIKKRSLFILDGTNMMYWNGDKIPTLFYIQKIVDYLQEHDLDYKVFFDIQSPHILKSEDDKNLYEEMIKDKRHYSQAPFRADILVLEKASTKENSAVISNDGYSKYKKEYPIIKDASRFYRGTVDCSDENKFILLQNRDEETIRIDI